MNEQKKLSVAGTEKTEITPMQLITSAMQQNVDIEKMQQLFELQMRWEKNEAKKAYNDAFSLFKSETFAIKKDKTASFRTKNGGQMQYDYITLANVVSTTVPLLSKYGLSHSWETKQEGQVVYVTCKISHRMGHSESVTLSSGVDTSGQKNPIQMIGSAVSYLQRYTLISILGLASTDQDDDGAASETVRDPERYITESQQADMQALIDEIKINEGQFLNWLRVAEFSDIPKSRYAGAMKKLEERRKK
jgi:hypothetical protein